MKPFRQTKMALVFLGVWFFAFGGVEPASAQWFSWGSNGSSGGSGGSFGGSWGSHGSIGGNGSIGGLWGSHGSNGGSWGSHGSNGGLWGSHGSNGGLWGSHGSNGGSWGWQGSSGGSWGSSGGYYTAQVGQPSATTPSTQVAYLNVNVPANAQVFLQGQRMALSGPRRRFVTPNLGDGRQHIYTVKVDIESNGRRISKTVEALVKAGQEVEVTVAFDPQNPNNLVAR